MIPWLLQKLAEGFGTYLLQPALSGSYTRKPAAFESASPDARRVRFPPWAVLLPGILGSGGLLYSLLARNSSVFLLALGLFSVAIYCGYSNATLKPETGAMRPLARSEAYVYTLRLPRGLDWKHERAYQLMNHLLLTFNILTFRIEAERGAIRWQILDLRLGVAPEGVVQAIRAIFPEADVDISPLGMGRFSQPFYRYIFKFRHDALFPAPMAYVEDLRDYDPLAGLTNALSELRAGERVVYTLHMGGLAPWAYAAGEAMITRQQLNRWQIENLAGLMQPAGRTFQSGDRQPVYIAELQRLFEAKLKGRLYQAALLLEIDTPHPARFDDLTRLLAHVDGFIRQPINGLILYRPEGDLAFPVTTAQADVQTDSIAVLNAWTTGRDPSWRQTQLVLEVREAAALWHPPHKGCHAASIRWATGQHTRLPQRLLGKRTGICLGDNHYGTQLEPVYWDTNDRLTHALVVGKTGVGKSSLMAHMARQDIAAGRGVTVIDPHGPMVSELLRFAIEKHRVKDVVVLDLADETHPLPLNPLASAASMSREEAITRFVGIMSRLYPELHRTQMADTFRMALRTLAADPRATVRDVPRVLEDVAYRDQLMAGLDDPALDDFWARFERLSAGQRDELTHPIAWRLRSFYGNRLLYPVLCHPLCLDFHALLAENKIILISLRAPETRLPETERNLVGALLIAQLQIAATSGAIRQRPYHLYIDEAHAMVTPALPKLFNEARKDGLSLTLGTQHFKQLAGDTLEAVMGNVGGVIAFACGPDDARTLAPFMKPGFAAEDLVNLDRFEAAVWLRDQGQTQPAFRLRTRKPVTETTDDELERARRREAIIRQHAATQFTPQDRETVLTWLRDRYPRRGQNATRLDDVDLYDPLN